LLSQDSCQRAGAGEGLTGVIVDLRSGLGEQKAHRAAVRFKLHDFDEAIKDRGWFDHSLAEYTDRRTDQSNSDWDVDTPASMAQALLSKLAGAPHRRYIEIGEGTLSLIMAKDWLELFEAVRQLSDE
jgi:hypothetical protein